MIQFIGDNMSTPEKFEVSEFRRIFGEDQHYDSAFLDVRIPGEGLFRGVGNLLERVPEVVEGAGRKLTRFLFR